MSGMLESVKQEKTKGKLVLTRGVDESVLIGSDIEVMVIRIGGDKVRLLVIAPKDVKVHRKEVTQKEDFKW